jgi:homoserine O-acetyltransferase/O-succinyltransferase
MPLQIEGCDAFRLGNHHVLHNCGVRRRTTMRIMLGALPAVLLIASAQAADVPPAQEAEVTLRDFRFHTGETLPELRMHYRTVGSSSGEPVLILHGTSQSGAAMMAPAFAGALFGPGQPLDASKYYIILPDSIGAGGSSKPSDGLRAKFPAYNYDDTVAAQYRVVTEGLHLQHLRLVMGFSMGGMQAWLWAEQHPDFADGFVPMASQPSPMASRNWMMRRLMVETIRHDPTYADGNYTAVPQSLPYAIARFTVGTFGGNLGWLAQAPTAAQADAIVARQLASPPPDANDWVFQWDSSHDYDAAPGLQRITRPVLVINSADDERNPPESGIVERAVARLPHGEYDLVPESSETRGHGTVFTAKFYAARLGQFLANLPPEKARP